MHVLRGGGTQRQGKKEGKEEWRKGEGVHDSGNLSCDCPGALNGRPLLCVQSSRVLSSACKCVANCGLDVVQTKRRLTIVCFDAATTRDARILVSPPLSFSHK